MRLKKTPQLVSSLLATVVTASLMAPPGRAAGVSKRSIKIGVHAPITGADPLPSDTVTKGADIYWEWRRQNDNPINGRHIEVVLKNDNYNPSQAVAVCKQMVEKEHVFMLSGLMNPEGKDQSQACARYAASVEVPYVGLGQMKVGVTELDPYFVFSMTWPAQSRLLAEFFVDRLKAKRRKNGMVRHDTPNYQDSHDSFVKAMGRRDAELDYDRAISNGASNTEAQTLIQELKLAEIENVFVLVRPTFFLQLLDAAGSQNYHPRWSGIGITMTTVDQIVDIGCKQDKAIAGAKFFSPLPAFGNRNEFDATYSRAMRSIYETQGDNISWLGWATSRQLAKLLERGGRALTRRRFVTRTERARHVRTEIMPGLNFRPSDHFGANATHVLRASCRRERWLTVGRFRHGF